MCGSILLFWYYTFIFVIPVYFLLLHIQEIGRADNFPLYYIGFNFLFPFLFSWVRYRKKRKSALMKHYRYPKKIKIISAIFFLLVPIVICGLEIWIYGKQGKHSKKCTFYTLRFGCSFAAVNTIKPQLL